MSDIKKGDLFDGNYSINGVGFIILSSILGGFLGTLLLYEALNS